MTSLRVLAARLLALLRTTRLEAELDEELRAHLDLAIADNLKKGMSPPEARRAALLQLGGVEQVKELYRERRGLPFLETLASDVRLGFRGLRRAPAFTAVVVLTLALGVGANTAVFQLLNAVRLATLPVAAPHRLAEVRITGWGHGRWISGAPYGHVSWPVFEEVRQRQRAFSDLAAWTTGGLEVGTGPERRFLRRLSVTGELFRLLGLAPWRGRLLHPEDAVCPATTAVVSHAYWRDQMGGQPLSEHSTLVADGGRLVRVVGVTPPGFLGLVVGESFDVALPLCRPEPPRDDVFYLAVLARLRPGWDLARATAHVDTLSPAVFTTPPAGYSPENDREFRGFRLAAVSAATGVSRLRDEYETSLWLLLGTTGLVLLIACANLASLMLARSLARGREIAVRLALGATRRRLVRQLLTEVGLLAAAGAACGVGAARLLGRGLVRALSTERAPVDLPLATDGRVLLFATALAVLTCAVVGALPALGATRIAPAFTGGVTGRRALQRVLVAAQIAVSLVLLVTALLFTATFRNLLTLDPGMRQRGITVAFLDFARAGLPPDRRDELRRRLLAEVRALPGVVDAATTTNVPLLGGNWGHRIWVGTVRADSRFTWVSPEYFATMGIPLVAGRGFLPGDRRGSPPVAVVNETFVARFLPGVDPLGKTVRTSSEADYPSTVYEIVGVVRDTSYNSLRGATPPMTFAPAEQFPAPLGGAAVMIHAGVPIADPLKRLLARAHPTIGVVLVDFQQRIRDGLVHERLTALLSAFIGLLAALLVGVGLFGVLSYMVARRRRELGIRKALGARTGALVRLVAVEAVRLVAIGAAIGTGLALLAGRAMASLLFGLAPHDPRVLAGAAALLLLTAAAAAIIPARRAARLDPMVALRDD